MSRRRLFTSLFIIVAATSALLASTALGRGSTNPADGRIIYGGRQSLVQRHDTRHHHPSRARSSRIAHRRHHRARHGHHRRVGREQAVFTRCVKKASLPLLCAFSRHQHTPTPTPTPHASSPEESVSLESPPPSTEVGPASPEAEPTQPEAETTPPSVEGTVTSAIPDGAEVDAAPSGPPAPAGGWHIAFADAFGAKLGYGPGEDNFWFLNKQEPANTDQSGLNSNELQVFNSNHVKVGAEGLELLETYSPNAGGTGKNYVGGLVNTADHASGQRPFAWKSGGATTWAFECIAKWPTNGGAADPGWWSDATVNGQENEIDFFEGFGWGKTWHTVKEWSGTLPTVVGLNYHTVYGVEKELKFDPTTSFHRYTTTVTPNGSRTIVSEFIDGSFKWSFEVEYPANRKTFTHLILSYALREFTEGFQEGTRFAIRSVAVYQDGAHAGQEVEGGGIAPGTVVR